MTPRGLDDVIGGLCARTGLAPPAHRHPIRIWALSAVESITLADGDSVICKYARPPFTREAMVLETAANHGLPVPRVHAHLRADDWLIMILEDLGDPIRTPTDQDGAIAAARLHRAELAIPNLTTSDGEALASLPHVMLDTLRRIRASRVLDVDTTTEQALATVARNAKQRSAGAATPPFGLVHGELHPTSVHISSVGTRLLDFGMAFNGPAILDLATWQGTRHQPNLQRLTDQLDAYVAAGGTKYIHKLRGGLNAAAWALGWHRLHSAAWLLKLTATGSDAFTPDSIRQILRRQIAAAAVLLR